MLHHKISTVLYTYEDGKTLPELGGCVKHIVIECDCIEWLIFAHLWTENMVLTMSYL